MTTYATRWGTWGWRYWRQGKLHQKAGFKSKREAAAAEHDHRRKLGVATGSATDITLREYAERWLATVAGEVARSTHKGYDERLRNHVLPQLGQKTLREITRADVKRLLQAKREQGYARNGVRLMKASLSALLSDAADENLIPTNPALQVGRRRQGGADRAPATERRVIARPFSAEERDFFLEVAARRTPSYALLFELLAKTGLRPSEAYALQSSDLDLKARQLRVERSWVLGAVKPTKTHEARRVELPGALAALLGAQAQRSVRVAIKRKRPPAWLFPNEAGEPLDKSKVGKAFRRALKAAKLPHRRLYDLRHTYTSLRIAAGAPPTYVAAQLGHASAVTTMQYYARWAPTSTRQWVEDDTGSARTTHVRSPAGRGSGKTK